jgi:hypothetical protein
MYPLYKDIREKLGAPLWHDSHGVPRYAEFHPSLLGVYDEYAVLFLVQCQSCHQVFPCAVGHSKHVFTSEMKVLKDVHEFIQDYVGWGDAPHHEDIPQCAGTTMSTSVVKLLSVWEKNRHWEQVEITQSMTDLVTDY